MVIHINTNKTVKPVTSNKINKINPVVVKVNINQVKPQVTYIKRVIQKYLVSNKLVHINSTKTKPQSIKLTTLQSTKLQVLIKSTIKGLVTNPNYLHTTVPQTQYITNHLNTHTSKYLV